MCFSLDFRWLEARLSCIVLKCRSQVLACSLTLIMRKHLFLLLAIMMVVYLGESEKLGSPASCPQPVSSPFFSPDKFPIASPAHIIINPASDNSQLYNLNPGIPSKMLVHVFQFQFTLLSSSFKIPRDLLLSSWLWSDAIPCIIDPWRGRS